MVLGYFGNFRDLSFIAHFRRFEAILVILMNMGIFFNRFIGFRGILVILEVSRYFRSFYRFVGLFWSFKRF